MSYILKGLMTEKNKTKLDTVKEDQKAADDLQYAFQQAKNITSQIKNDRTVNEILTNIELLIDKYNIDRNAFEVAETEVKNAQRQLEAAIYGLDEIFQDAMKKAQWGSDELTETDMVIENIDPNDLADELFNKHPNIVRQYGHEVVGDTLLKVLHRSPNKDLNSLVDEVISTLRLSVHKTDESQIYATGAGYGQASHKYKVKPAGS